MRISARIDEQLHDIAMALVGGPHQRGLPLAIGGINVRTERAAPAWKLRMSGAAAHRLELIDGPCWTLFVTGPRYREWGFHCPQRGWVPWKEFTSADNSGEIGRGCEQ